MPQKKKQPAIPDAVLDAAMHRELASMDAALAQEAACVGKPGLKRSKGKRSGLGIQRAMVKYAMGELTAAVAILREAVAQADESMPAKEPYRFYMHAVLADWLSEAGEVHEAAGHLDIAWVFVTTESAGAVYLEEVRERKRKVDERRQTQSGSSESLS